MREERYRITVGNGESTSKMSILGWGSSTQGVVSTGTVETEVYSHLAGVRVAENDNTEEMDMFADMRERVGSRATDGEPTTETIDRVSEGDGNGGEDNEMKNWPSTVDGGNNRGVSGSGMRLISYASPERCVDLFGIQGKVTSSMLVGTFVSIIMLDTDEEVLGVFHEYAHNPSHQQAIHSTLQLTAHGMNVEDGSPRFGTPPSIMTPQGDVIPLSFVEGLPILHYDAPRIWK